MVNLPICPAQNIQSRDSNHNLLETFEAIREMKKVLYGARPVISRIDEEKMEEIQEYLSPGNEEEVVDNLINERFNWIINVGSHLAWIFNGSNFMNKTWCKTDSDRDTEWRKNNLVPEFIVDTAYELFQLLLRHPEVHRKARNCNHLFCLFWPYAVWAYRQILEENLEKKHEWNSAMEKVTKAIWTSYAPETYKKLQNSPNVDVGRFVLQRNIENRTCCDMMQHYIGANQVLDKFRQVAFDVMKKNEVPLPSISILYYELRHSDNRGSNFSTVLLPIQKNNPMKLDDQLLLKSEIESDMWQIETSLLVQMGIYDRSESLSYLDKVCQGFFK